MQGFSSVLVNTLKTEYGLLNPTIELPDKNLENSTFIILNKQEKYTAKLYKESLRARTIAGFQNYLSGSTLPVPRVVLTKSEGYVAALGNYSNLVLSGFAKGMSISSIEDSGVLPMSLTASIAEVVAGIHKASQSMNVDHRLDHPLSVRQTIAKNRFKVKLSENDLEPIRQIMIHGDITADNILVNRSHNAVKAIFDFGDSHYDYLTYDIAILLTHLYVTSKRGIDYEGIDKFLIIYNRLDPLSIAELKTILPLMELRNLTLMQYADKMSVKDSAYRKVLEPIKQSSEVKLDILQKHERDLKDIILSVSLI